MGGEVESAGGVWGDESKLEVHDGVADSHLSIAARVSLARLCSIEVVCSYEGGMADTTSSQEGTW